MQRFSFHEERVLVLALKQTENAGKTLKDAGIASESCSSIDEVCNKAETAGAALIDAEALTPEARDRIKAFRESEPAWSDFPLIVVDGGSAEVNFWTSDYFSELGSVMLLDRPIHVQTLVSALRSALWSRCRQFELRRLMEEHERDVSELDGMAELASQLLVAEKPEELSETVFRKIALPLGFEIYIFRLFEERTGSFRVHSSAGLSHEDVKQLCRQRWNEELIARVVRERKPFVIQNVQASTDECSAILRDRGIQAWVCHPLISGTHLIGTFCLGTRNRTKFNHEELAILETVCDEFAVAIARRRVERELQRLNEHLNQKVQERTEELQEMLDQMEAFSYSVAHDLRSPLRIMRGFSQALLEDYETALDDTGKDYLRRIDSAAHKMDVLIRDLLEYSRIGRSELVFEPINLDELVNNVLFQLQEETFEKKAGINVVQPLGIIQGNVPTLHQAITNLLTNALKFMAPGVEPRVTIRSERRGQNIRLWIEDNGIGIAREHQHKIFGVFERLHGTESYPGTGIGLAIVVKVIRRMGGSVGVESAAGKGSRFWVELPGAALAVERAA